MCRWEDSGVGGLRGGIPEQLTLSSKNLHRKGLSQDQAQLCKLGDLKVIEPYLRESKRVPSPLSR